MPDRLITTLVFLTLGAALLPFGATAAEFLVQPYLQSASPTDIWILWETTDGTETRVDWGTSEQLENSTLGRPSSAPDGALVHEVHLTDLQPSTLYYYQAYSDDAVSEVHLFRTPAAPEAEASFRLIAISDTQMDDGNPDKLSEVIHEGILEFSRTELGGEAYDTIGPVLVAGDLVSDGLVREEWRDDFFRQTGDLMATVPFYPVLGNHDSNSPSFFQYFHFPENGTPGFEGHWWYTDYSNVRIIGLDSNFRIQPQLDWLDEVLTQSCADDQIDFVIAEQHHPLESELWPDGETPFTGNIIVRLEQFSTGCGKPSILLYGHTHGYSRGESRDHTHLMVNVATASGNIDYWGEYEQIDYEDFSVSQDEYGFVVMDVQAGDDPQLTLRRISRGDEYMPLDNELRDEVTLRLHNTAPETPVGVEPRGDGVSPDCVYLQATDFFDPDGDGHGDSHWQIATSCTRFDSPVLESWLQHENWYYDEDLQAGDDLTDELVTGLQPNTSYCWRVRYRDQGLAWSEWSPPAAFSTGPSGTGEPCEETPPDDGCGDDPSLLLGLSVCFFVLPRRSRR